MSICGICHDSGDNVGNLTKFKGCSCTYEFCQNCLETVMTNYRCPVCTIKIPLYMPDILTRELNSFVDVMLKPKIDLISCNLLEHFTCFKFIIYMLFSFLVTFFVFLPFIVTPYALIRYYDKIFFCFSVIYCCSICIGQIL